MDTRAKRDRRRRDPARVTRRTIWRRAKIQRVIAALLAAGALWVGVSAASADPEGPHTDVVTMAVDAASGHWLQPADLEVRAVPSVLAPHGSSGSIEDWTGQRLAAPIRVGEVLTDADVSVAALAQGQPRGYVVTHLPLSSVALARAAPAGAQVDVLSTADGSMLATDVVVVAVSAADDSGEGPGLFVAVSPSDAQAIAVASGSGSAAALAGSGVTIVLRTDGDASPP
ncbi:MAG: SAF domain-containing protein [Ornithinimicrobium sp.]